MIRALLLALVSLACAAAAQAQERVYKIGIVSSSAAPTADGSITGGGPMQIKDLLAQRGYREGANVIYDFRAGGRDQARTDQAARDLVATKPDMIIVQTTDAGSSVQKAVAGTDIPVVAWGTDLVQAGFVKSFSRSGTNFTGFSLVPEHQMSMLRIIKMVVPKAKKVAHLYNPTFAPAPSTLRELKSAAALFNLDLPVYEAQSVEAIDAAFAKMAADKVDAVIVGPHPLFNAQGAHLGELALKYRLPMVSWEVSALRPIGAIAAFSPPDGWSQMADRMDLILKGKARAPDLPILRIVKGAMTINLKSAKALGLTIPQSLIEEATTLIE